MAQRFSHESPMDFEFQNGTGPIDTQSPFARLGQRFPPGSSNKMSFNFDSPEKRPFHPTTTTPGKHQLPAFNSLFTTPRKVTNEMDDSSAGETPKSPEAQDDVSDATPEQKPLFRSNGRRDSWIYRLKSKLNSPGRGEIPRVDPTEGTEKRITKRRRREVDRKLSRRKRRRGSASTSSSDADGEDGVLRRPRRQGSHQNENWLSSTFTFIGRHPTVPHILSYYAQLAFNIFLLTAIAYLLYCFWSAVQGDVDKKSHEAMAEIMIEMAACAKQYKNNDCDKVSLPAMEAVCANWERCMNQDPSKLVGRAHVGARTFAEIYNSFVEPISWKAAGFTFAIVVAAFTLSNLAFVSFRRSEAMAYAPPPYYPPPPQQNQQRYDLPQQQQHWNMNIEGSPVRKIMY
ncbi:hypothetical protein K470DRAFT_267916 [Piedraia hortae CBS 480.64]|uniref:Brl1/Brr6 domain-containing protein n=1 Tax=Piedraia hortae CBS 480.64 TaxID=1314780 RepID=A0A6A7C925_9PEZI|nr:hypothetical protein K470DRAFT_267916 [Piedraia hortae CBS 480.64]